MSNLAFPLTPRLTERLGGTAENLATVTSGAGAWGAWTSLGGSLTRDADEIVVFARTDSSVGERFYLSLAVGAGSDTNMVIDALPGVTPSTPAWPDTYAFRCPIRVPAGQTVFAKTASTAAVAQTVGLLAVSSGMVRRAGFGRLEALVVDLVNVRAPQFTAVSGGGTTWVEYIASTARAYRGLWLRPDTIPAAVNRRFSIRVGLDGTSVTQIISEQFASKNSAYVLGDAGLIPVHVPAGSRVMVAINGDTAAEPIRLHMMGLVA